MMFWALAGYFRVEYHAPEKTKCIKFSWRAIKYFEQWTIPQLDKLSNWKMILAQLERAS